MGKTAFRSVPISLAYSCFNEVCKYRFAASPLSFSSAISTAASFGCYCIRVRKVYSYVARFVFIYENLCIHIHSSLFSFAAAFRLFSKSESIFCVLLNSSYSAFAFSSACVLLMLPLPLRMSYFRKAKNSLILAANSSIVNVFSRSIRSPPPFYR